MCRHLGYLGPAVSVAEVLTLGPTSLMTQSWAPSDMRGGGTVNADGFGAAWWPEEHAVASRSAVSYRSAQPIWSDPAVSETLSLVRSTAVLAAVRSATVGMPVERSACAPFTAGGWAFSHNGVVRGWPQSLAAAASGVPIEQWLTLPAPTDSAALWVMLEHRLRSAPDTPAEHTLAAFASEIADAAPRSRLNLLLGDGHTLYGTALDHSLWVRRDDESVIVASEPIDARDGWQPVPDGSVVTATLDDVRIRPL